MSCPTPNNAVASALLHGAAAAGIKIGTVIRQENAVRTGATS